MSFNHLMIDIETLGTKSNSIILSIAAVNFDISTGKTGAYFKENISIDSCLYAGLKMDEATLKWWLNQDNKVLKSSLNNEKQLPKVVVDFVSFVKNLRKGLIVWGNSARFDLGIIENAFNAVGFLVPSEHWNERDVRTLVSLAPHIKKETKFLGDKHNPIDDCYHQINYCTKTWNALKND